MNSPRTPSLCYQCIIFPVPISMKEWWRFSWITESLVDHGREWRRLLLLLLLLLTCWFSRLVGLTASYPSICLPLPLSRGPFNPLPALSLSFKHFHYSIASAIYFYKFFLLICICQQSPPPSPNSYYMSASTVTAHQASFLRLSSATLLYPAGA